MSPQPSNPDNERPKILPRIAELYAAWRPMDELPDQYLVTDSNPKPLLVHFAIPVNTVVLYRYAEEYKLTKYLRWVPNVVSPATLVFAAEHLSKYVNYELEFGWPFEPTADSEVILSLYDNYSMDDKMLMDEDEEDVIDMVQEALGLDKSVRPKWYFDGRDAWKPGSDKETVYY